ncbi:lantibiotic dehydratase C-terminal domain-containing protein [Deinococcus multiflagellatus]|uniref:Lantibiotic dehydratase C-terminal domain-containing protein n=1 Tax=Deinococcus multiflagellatus TaxID=1656887 RepID=A0ABW1ZRS8_9DEIO|nr:lantibiotic dehydratase C-terminal domain-containing protein [Deinococcus multiflagellatus]MBZ9715148.1 hypothetical protein [Deinococcus multiflagellatus]
MNAALYVTHYASEKRPLLRDLILPLVLELQARAGVTLAYAERHWKFGPHVRVIVQGEDGAVQAALAYAQEQAEAYLREYPSTGELDEAAYLARSEKLGTLELEAGPYGPIRPDNSVLVGEAPDRREVLGSPEAEAFRAQYFAALTPALLRTLQADAGTNTDRLIRLARIFVLYASTYPFGVYPGHISYRSHLEEFLFRQGGGERLRAAFAQKYAPIRDEVLRAVDGVASGARDEVLSLWETQFRRLWPVGRQLADAGLLAPDPTATMQRVAAGINPEAQARWAFGPDYQFSEFHQELRKFNISETWYHVEMFSTYRTLMNFMYSALPLMDISPTERYFVNYMVSEAMQELHGQDWRGFFDQWWVQLREEGVA